MAFEKQGRFPGDSCDAVVYLSWIGTTKLMLLVNVLQRRRESDRMPKFSLHGNMLRMTGRKTAAQEKSLDELDRVRLITTSRGPYVCDRFLTLEFHDGSEWSVPLDTPSRQSFYDALGKALPLDHEQALFAAFSTAGTSC